MSFCNSLYSIAREKEILAPLDAHGSMAVSNDEYEENDVDARAARGLKVWS